MFNWLKRRKEEKRERSASSYDPTIDVNNPASPMWLTNPANPASPLWAGHQVDVTPVSHHHDHGTSSATGCDTSSAHHSSVDTSSHHHHSFDSGSSSHSFDSGSSGGFDGGSCGGDSGGGSW